MRTTKAHRNEVKIERNEVKDYLCPWQRNDEKERRDNDSGLLMYVVYRVDLIFTGIF
jgi:hypothetical protein